MRARPLALALIVGLGLIARPAPAGESAVATRGGDDKPALRIGAVAYSPAAVTIFEGIRRYLGRNGLPVDYVLYSNYDALVEALDAGHVDIAWNTPLAHARYHRKAGKSRTLVMRDVDCGFRSVLVARKGSGIDSPGQLAGKTLVLGSEDAAEATVLPRHYLGGEGVDLDAVEVLSLDGAVDLEGNPCSSEQYVLKALGERLWRHLQQDRPEQAGRLVAVWTTPPFSHCVFTAGDDLDATLARRFTELMTAMDPDDPDTADVMRLEGTRAWVAGSPDGFRDLLEALGESR